VACVEQIRLFLNVGLPGMVRQIPGVRQAHGAVPNDSKDDMVIAAALEANAAYIISEDRHLLALGEYQGIKVMERRQFAAELDRIGVPPLKPGK
jgi:predicted nucleic acid-binding protein